MPLLRINRPSRAWLLPAFVGLLLPALAATDPVRTERKWHQANRTSASMRLYVEMPDPIEYSEARIQPGDDPRWARPDFDDLGWKINSPVLPPVIPTRAGITWLRLHIRWTSPEGHLPEGLMLFNGSLSYEFYWDGVLIGQNGTPANSAAEEVEGKSLFHPALPRSLTGPGEHVLALRFSSQRAPEPYRATRLLVISMSPDVFDASFRRDNFLPVMAAGVMLTLALAALVMWVVTMRQRVLLLFAGMCFFGAIMVGARWYSLAYIYPYSWRHGLNWAVTATGLAMSLCLAAVIAAEWKIPRERWWLAGLLVVDGGLLAHDYPFLYYTANSFIGASYIFVAGSCVWGGRRRQNGPWVMAVMVAISAVLLWLRPEHFVGLDIFQAFLPTVLGVLLTIALRLRAERRQAQETRLVAARMEIELLKKNLQPHFLMNTLTALSQTVEEEPARAVRLIDDLSQEFRTLSRMASEKTVTLAEELELCRAHLRVMRARTDVDWELAVDGVEGGVRVPPALFLTLIENGFSHQVARPADRTFTLRMTAQGGRVRFEFLSPGEVTAETTRVAGGTGLRYVRARLEESFPGQWTLTQAAVNGGWLTVIEIPGDNSKGVPA